MRTLLAFVAALALLSTVACGDDSSAVSASTPAAEEPATTSGASDEAPALPTPAIDAEYVGGDGARVAVLGDSITVQSRDALVAALPDAALRFAAVRGEGFAGGGYSTAWETQLMLGAAAELGASEPDIAVVALGTNDAWTPDGTLPDALDALDTIVGDLAGACLVVVLVDGDAPAEDFDADAAATINERLSAAADEVVDWGEVAAEDGVLTDDGIHPTPEGQQAWAEAVAAGVEDCSG